MESFDLSAIVISYNEGHLLDRCLKSISFCDEILLIDLFSTDNTPYFANYPKVNYVKQKREPIVERLRKWGVSQVSSNWVLFVDPDEVVDVDLREDIQKVISDQNSNEYAILSLPYQYYYGQYPLKGTAWGGRRHINRIIHKERALINEEVHLGFVPKPGYSEKNIQFKSSNVIHHYWMHDKKQFFEKHRRYLEHEGSSMSSKGLQYSILVHFYKVLTSFIYSFFYKKGFLDGYLGLRLSFFYSWYIHRSWQSLRDYVKEENL